jgi:hypothetical protein
VQKLSIDISAKNVGRQEKFNDKVNEEEKAEKFPCTRWCRRKNSEVYTKWDG